MGPPRGSTARTRQCDIGSVAGLASLVRDLGGVLPTRLERRHTVRQVAHGAGAVDHPATAGAEDGGDAVSSRATRNADPCHPAMVKALARAHRWERMLQENRCVSIGGVW
jgi:hypothetical protein